MLPGLLRFVFLIVFVFVAACAGDAAPPMVVVNDDTNIRPEMDTSLPNNTDHTDTGDDDVQNDVDPSEDVPEDTSGDVQGDTDIAEDVDPPTPTCAAHTECTDEELCILNVGNGKHECTIPSDCTTDANCTAPQVCAFDYNLTIPRTVCLEPAGPGQLGDSCTDDNQCASNLCLNQQCATPCARPVDCSDDGSFICTPQEIEHGNTTETVNVCTPKPLEQCISDDDCAAPERCVLKSTLDGPMFVCAPPAGPSEPGVACTINADCASNLCLDNVCTAPCAGNHHCNTDAGHTCEVVPVTHNGQPVDVSVCQPPVECERNGQCLLTEVCYVRKTNTEVQTHCKPPNVGGAKPVGATCTTDESCASNLCLQGRFHKHCAPACSTNADCTAPAGSPVQYECKSTTFTLAGGTDSAKVCVAKAAPACTSQSQCATGTHCAVVTNAANNGLETVCIPLAGGRAPGAACTANDQCNGQLCLNGTCSQPCTARDQCGTQQLCRTNNVQKSGFSRSLQVCETPPAVPCTSNLDCTDGVRICADIRTLNNTTQGYCSFPNPAGAPTGTNCTADSQCHSEFCLSITDQCTLLCSNNSQCGGGNQICTTYSGLGACVPSCTSNSDCTPGHSCAVNNNTNTNSFDYVCERNVGPNPLGTQVPVNDNSCQSGLVIWRGDSPRYCSALCDPSNGNNDCLGKGVPGNPLTVCDPISLTSAGITETVWACALP